jgi:hypothetical protein
MRLNLLFILVAFSWSNVLNVNVLAPEYQIYKGEFVSEHASFIGKTGAPNLPCRNVTIALPPAAIVESVRFTGAQCELGIFSILPVQPALPLMNDKAIKKIMEQYTQAKDKFYSSNNIFPEEYGVLLSKGGLRKYTLVNVACYHFAYNPVSKKLYYTPYVNVEIKYRIPPSGSDRAQFYKRLNNDITFDDIAEQTIYNWEDAKQWYYTDTPDRADGYTVITTAALQNSVDTLVSLRQNQGYDVNVITKEYIESNIPGDDLEQKIRNYLRDNMADIEFVLLVGTIVDIPMRYLVPFNDDPDSPFNDLDVSPIPSDVYYTELTDPCSLSWNSDRDQYYGEVYDSLMQPNGDDSPDYHADIHLGRIPFTTQSNIEEISAKLVSFDINTDRAYKTGALLAGGMIYFANENHSGRPRMDGADMMEQLMDEGIINRVNADFLYEETGLRACSYPCTDSLTNANMISYWNNKGVVLEYNHGMPTSYWRKIWAWDDGDSVPESYEIQFPLGLQTSDVFQLDNNHPATTFLRSCLCGKPEENGLGKYLLYRGSSTVFCGTRIVWASPLLDEGLGYHFLKSLMQDTTLSKGVMGRAWDIAKNDFMGVNNFWINIYLFQLYGEPALRQFGGLVGIQERSTHKPVTIPTSFGPTIFSGPLLLPKDKTYKVFDITGRIVVPDKIKPGIYFVEVDGVVTQKVIKIR